MPVYSPQMNSRSANRTLCSDARMVTGALLYEDIERLYESQRNLVASGYQAITHDGNASDIKRRLINNGAENLKNTSMS